MQNKIQRAATCAVHIHTEQTYNVSPGLGCGMAGSGLTG